LKTTDYNLKDSAAKRLFIRLNISALPPEYQASTPTILFQNSTSERTH